MTKHTISDKLKTTLSSIPSISESNDATLTDAYYSKIGVGQNAAIKMNDSFADVAAKIFNLIALNKKDRKFKAKVVKIENAIAGKHSVVEDTHIDDTKEIIGKSDDKADKDDGGSSFFGSGLLALGYKAYQLWKMLGVGKNLGKLIPMIARFGKTIFKQIFKFLMPIFRVVLRKALPMALRGLSYVPGPVGFAAKVATIGAAVYGLGINDAIASSESGGNYNAIFGHVNGDESIQKKHGKQLSELTVAEVQKIANERKGDNAGAVGKYQFMPTTLADLVKKSKIDPNTTLFDKNTQDMLQNILLSENRAALKRHGIEDSPTNLKMAHYIGSQGTIDLHKDLAAGKNITVAESMTQHNHSVGSKNKELHNIKIQDFGSVLAGRMSSMENAPTGTKTQPAPMQIEITKGVDLVDSSKNRSTAIDTSVIIQPIVQQVNSGSSGSNLAMTTTSSKPIILKKQ